MDKKEEIAALIDAHQVMQQMRLMLTEQSYKRRIPVNVRDAVEGDLDMALNPDNSVFISNRLHIA